MDLLTENAFQEEQTELVLGMLDAKAEKKERMNEKERGID